MGDHNYSRAPESRVAMSDDDDDAPESRVAMSDVDDVDDVWFDASAGPLSPHPSSPVENNQVGGSQEEVPAPESSVSALTRNAFHYSSVSPHDSVTISKSNLTSTITVTHD